MTKKVRVENADGSNYKVVVQVWDKGADGAPDTMVREVNLDFPTSLADDIYIHSTRYLVVKEA